MPPLDYEPNPRGMGYEFFHSMLKFHNRVAQIDAETGEEDKYGSYLKRCIRTALVMQAYGVTSEDIICLCTNNHLNSSVPFIATLFLGAKAASLDPTLSLADTIHLIKLVMPKIFFVISSAEKLIKTALEEIGTNVEIVVFKDSEYSNLIFDEFLKPHPEEDSFLPISIENNKETAVILFSSGTTGLPKGICISHYGILCQGITLEYDLEEKEVADDLVKYSCRRTGLVTSVSLAYSSLYWISAVELLTASVVTGTTRLICSHFDPIEAWHYIEKYKVSFMFGAPNQAIDIYKSGRPEGIDTTNFLEFCIGGAAIPKQHLHQLRDVFPGTNVSQCYGQTEMSGVIALFKANDRRDNMFLLSKLESCGKPVDGVMCKVVDIDTEKIQGPGNQGELRIKSKFLMNGYYNQDSSSAWDSDGWFKTGDIVYYDNDHFLHVVDRIKEMLKYRSWHVAPAVLENILALHPAIHTGIVIGIPHPEDGDHPMACVILNDNVVCITPEEIVKFVEERVHDRQRLRGGVKFIQNFPTTPTGKVRRRDLRDMILRGKI